MSKAPIDQSVPVRPEEALDLDRLQDYLQQRLPGAEQALQIEQFPSGYSNLTYLIRVGDQELVLRRPPVGAQVATGHDMSREYRVLSKLHRVYAPAPRPALYCEDPDVIGAPFYLMERRHGVILRRKIPEGLEVTPPVMGQMCRSLIDALADLHAVDYQAAGLGDLGKPKGYVERQVEGWLGRWERAKTEEITSITEVGRWLRENMPAQGNAALVHNDFKFDNVVLDPSDPTRIVAVLDWEMATLGEPLMDLGTTLGYWVQADDDPIWQAAAFGPTYAPGAWTRQQLVEHYAARTGRDVSNMLFYYCFALIKIAVIGQQIYVRYLQGHTKDPRFAGLGELVKLLGTMASRAAGSGRY